MSTSATTSTSRARRPVEPGLVVAALGGLLVFLVWGNATRGYIDTPALPWWWAVQWFNAASEAEHGPLVAGLAAWLFWRGARRQRAAPNPSRRGVALAVLGGGLALHALGYAVEQPRVSVVAMLVCGWAGLAWAGGARWARAAVFPVGFLLWAMPVNLLDTVGFWLRLGVVETSAAIARAAGIEVVRSGTQLFSAAGHYHYDVAAACSGLRSLVALGALTTLVAYLWVRPWWLRAAVWLAGVPLVVAGNIARILLLIVVAEWLGPRAGDAVHGPAGLLVFLVVLGGELVLVRALTRCRPAWGVGGGAAAMPAADGPWWVPPEVPAARPEPGRRAAAWITGAAIVATIAWCEAARRVPLAEGAGVRLAADGRDPAELPTFLGTEWMGRAVEVTAVERELLPAGTGYSRKLYTHLPDGRQVFFSVVLGGRDRSSLHRPELCLVGQGWTIRGSEARTLAAGALAVPATVLQLARSTATTGGDAGDAAGPAAGERPELLAYFFVGRDTITGTHGGRLWRAAIDRLVRREAARWAYVIVQTRADDGAAPALARIEAVLADVLPQVLTLPPAAAGPATAPVRDAASPRPTAIGMQGGG